jgi:V/A-type H+/Na+-transporting ATPase subunit C
MPILRARAEFTYGNTRLRARRAALLSRGETEALLGRDLDGVLAGLAATSYRPDVEAALARHHGLRAVHAAVRSRSTRLLVELRSFYNGVARELVDQLLARVDTATLVTLLRGLASGAAPDDIVELTVPAGTLDIAVVREVARQPDIVAGARLLAAWRLPDPDTARVLRQAIHEYELHEDLAALEQAVASARARHTATALALLGSVAGPLRELQAAAVDDTNRLLALRLRRSAERGEAVPAEQKIAYLAGGATPPHALQETLDPTSDPVALQALAEERLLRRGIARFATGDPLGIDIPLAFTFSLEAEGRNVRLIAAAAASQTPAELVRPRLVLA